MADLTNHFAGIRSPNPFWLASAPPTDKAYNVHRAFEAGWGGVVWKTIGEPIRNVGTMSPGHPAVLARQVHRHVEPKLAAGPREARFEVCEVREPGVCPGRAARVEERGIGGQTATDR